ncbi:MAG TPA: HK97 family phage prohead protease [Albitalea sp.]|nr:HK97 family phage prohead protease [Albitalea sp.]
MSTRTPEIRLSAPLELRAANDPKVPAQFSGVAYSGGLVPSFGCVIDISSTTLAQRMPLLMEHSRSDMIGVVETNSTAGNRITVGGKLFSDMPGTSAERLALLAQRGGVFQMSIGLFGYTEEVYPAGHAVTVNGKAMTGPVVVLRNGKVREVSIVTLGADHNTDVRMFRAPQIDRQRDREIDALFADLRVECGPFQRATYHAMSDELFAMLAQDLRNLSSRLTRAQTIAASLSVNSVYAKRREQARLSHQPDDADEHSRERRTSLSAEDIYARRRRQLSGGR